MIFEISILALSVVLSFIISKSNLSQYQIPFTLAIFILLFVIKKLHLPSGRHWRILESSAFIILILWTVLTTGGTDSPFFFLIYFLVFSLSLLLEPLSSLTLTMLIIILFILNIKGQIPMKTAIPIFSLAFLTPFALTLAEERLQNERLKIREESVEENALLFLSLVLKKHLRSIREILEESPESETGHRVNHQVKIMEKLIEKYEKNS